MGKQIGACYHRKGKKEEIDFKKHMEEFEDAWQEFFKDKPEPSSEEESLEHQHEFVHWYNTERKQSDTGLTPEEMGDGML